MALARFRFEADGVEIVGEGVVVITGAPPADPRQPILDFLDQLDPEQLKAMALARMDMGSTDVVAEVLRVVRGIADGSVLAHG